MIITKTQYIKFKHVVSIVGRKRINKDSKKSYFDQKCLVTIIRFLGIPLFRSIKALRD